MNEKSWERTDKRPQKKSPLSFEKKKSSSRSGKKKKMADKKEKKNLLQEGNLSLSGMGALANF